MTAVGTWYIYGGKFVVYHPGPVFAGLSDNVVIFIMGT